jgi:hypothetical protein
MLRVLSRSFLAALLASVAACSAPKPSDGVVPTSLTATPAMVELPVGGGESLTVTAVFADGRVEDVTAKAAWISSDPSVARAAGNLVTGVSVGAALAVPFARFARGEDMIGLLERHSFKSIALSPAGATMLADVLAGPRTAVLLGAEGPGLAPELIARATGVRAAPRVPPPPRALHA